MTEKEIYDEFEAGGRAVLEKARAEAALIGKDVQDIIGPIVAATSGAEKTVAKDLGKFWNGVRAVWVWLMTFFQFLDSPADANGRSKFSSKRLIALASFVIGIRQLIIGDPWGALGCGVLTLVLAVISAVTRT
jgi:hypothetical protein